MQLPGLCPGSFVIFNFIFKQVALSALAAKCACGHFLGIIRSHAANVHRHGDFRAQRAFKIHGTR